MENQKIDKFGYAIFGLLLALLAYAGYVSFLSIDFNVLKKIETQKLILPPVATSSSVSAASQSSAQK